MLLQAYAFSERHFFVCLCVVALVAVNSPRVQARKSRILSKAATWLEIVLTTIIVQIPAML
jgi:2C-methyl-D-erythritol 2,4-cyclodiphosphate synthase